CLSSCSEHGTALDRRLCRDTLCLMLKHLALLLAFPIRGGVVLGDAPPLAQLPTEGTLYTPMQLSIPVEPATYRNPFDTADIEVIGIFQSPTGNQLVLPGFWMQPYVCEEPCETLALQSQGEPVWQVRLTPQEVGEWTYTLQARDNGGITTVLDGRFTVAASDERGFIRKGANGRYFQFSNSDAYF